MPVTVLDSTYQNRGMINSSAGKTGVGGAKLYGTNPFVHGTYSERKTCVAGIRLQLKAKETFISGESAHFGKHLNRGNIKRLSNCGTHGDEAIVFPTIILGRILTEIVWTIVEDSCRCREMPL